MFLSLLSKFWQSQSGRFTFSSLSGGCVRGKNYLESGVDKLLTGEMAAATNNLLFERGQMTGPWSWNRSIIHFKVMTNLSMPSVSVMALLVSALSAKPLSTAEEEVVRCDALRKSITS